MKRATIRGALRTGAALAVSALGVGLTLQPAAHAGNAATPVFTIAVFINSIGPTAPDNPAYVQPSTDNATWTFDVTNSGGFALAAPTVLTDNGTPDLDTDDWAAEPVLAAAPSTFNVGDTDSDGVFDINEIWKFTTPAANIVPAVAAEFTLSATATATNAGTPGTATAAGTYVGATSSVTLEKLVQTDISAPTAPGPFVASGGAVTWVYSVTNTGNTELTKVTVTDSPTATIVCTGSQNNEIAILAAGATVTCTANGTAVTGPFTNTASVTGTAFPAPEFLTNPTGTATAHYFGVVNGLTVKKSVQKDDANTAPGPNVATGGNASFTYLVTNTGNAAVTAVTVTDNKIASVTCPKTQLAAGEAMTCTATAPAVAGAYTNTATATATGPSTVAANGAAVAGAAISSATDAANYFGVQPKIDIETAVNTFDADDATGLIVAAGTKLNITYVVKNTGNVALTGVTVKDDKIASVTCPANTLAVAATMTCTGSANAPASGQFTNVGTATGVGPATVGADGAAVAGAAVSDSDKTNAFVPKAAVEVVMRANGVDANTPGLKITAGRTVSWTAKVTNTGNVDLTTVRVSSQVTLTCPGGNPIPKLAIGKSVTCTATSKAVLGTVTYNASATGIPAVTRLTGQPAVTISNPNDSDLATYAGQQGGLPVVGATVRWTAAIALAFVGLGLLLSRVRRRPAA